MKLCQKCKSGFNPIWNIVLDQYEAGNIKAKPHEQLNFDEIIDLVPESECEFWAHKELNDAFPTYGEWRTGTVSVSSGQSVEVEFDRDFSTGTSDYGNYIESKVKRWRFVYPPKQERRPPP